MNEQKKYFFYFRRGFFLCASFLVVFGAAKGWQLYTDGFRIDKIQTALPEETGTLQKDFLPILDQTFTYLDKGCQAYVFQSEDKKYVLKLVRYHKYRVPFWMHFLDFFPGGERYRESREKFRKQRLFCTLRSYRIAFETLSEETGMVCLHLNKTHHLQKKIHLVDRTTKSYFMDADSLSFILQKKAKNLSKTLLEAKREKHLPEAKKLMESFLQTTHSLYKKGIVIRDYNCIKNAGVLDGQVIHIDLGSFYPKEHLDDPNILEAEFWRFTKHFRRWALQQYPELLPVLEQSLTELIAREKGL